MVSMSCTSSALRRGSDTLFTRPSTIFSFLIRSSTTRFVSSSMGACAPPLRKAGLPPAVGVAPSLASRWRRRPTLSAFCITSCVSEIFSTACGPSQGMWKKDCASMGAGRSGLPRTKSMTAWKNAPSSISGSGCPKAVVSAARQRCRCGCGLPDDHSSRVANMPRTNASSPDVAFMIWNSWLKSAIVREPLTRWTWAVGPVSSATEGYCYFVAATATAVVTAEARDGGGNCCCCCGSGG
mmetsp:Transcript_46457/g.145374  ORF Transcript_46457/g.145374 Transcript_46457/m.145374 type:complete len:239 (+) Transcript_46457:615-1331(+)